MDERRKAPRKQTDDFFGIYNRETDEFIGKLLDLSAKGMMISAIDSMETKTTYEIRIIFPKPIEGKNMLTFDAECVWCSESHDPNKKYNAGFHITDINSKDVETIKNLLNNALFYDEEQPRMTLAKKST